MGNMGTGDSPSLAERVERLAKRIERLERLEAGRPEPGDRAGAGPEAGPVSGPDSGPEPVPAAGAAATPAAESFWALDGLKRRAPEPGAVLFAGTVELPDGRHCEWQQGLPAEGLLDDDWTGLADTMAALSHPVRLLLLREILRGARTTAELSAHERLGTTGQLYHHLRQLVSAGWLRTSARGRYEVPGERVVPLLVVLSAARR